MSAMTIVSVEALNTPVLKNPTTLAQFSEAFIDRVNATCPAGQQHFTIRLSNDTNPLPSGDLAEVEPRQVTTTLRARVYENNNQPVHNINISLETTVEPNSGGHVHDINRPRGLLSNGAQAGTSLTGNTGSDGMAFTFRAPAPAGDHKIRATCLDRNCTQEGPDKVWVGFKDIIEIPSSNSYALTEVVNGQTVTIGASAAHPANHHLTQEALERLAVAAEAYREIYPNNPRLHLNDASLERGGIYDISSTWARPHRCHSRGYSIDVRANDRAGAIPPGDRQNFRERLESWGIPVGHEYQGLPQEHFHLYLLSGGCEP